ncbi:HAMP domain-containing protein, partial [candidate division WOR-3 bacterium]|nr:HAMP domain-containing protein [candidate division WOR-3 bacterium]
MTMRRFFQVVYGCFFALAVAQAVLAGYLLVNQRNLHRSQRVRFQSYLVADELRQSSDDLTRFARTYVATGDQRYEQYYWDVLAIRNGDKARPISYNRIYWDLVAGEGRPPRPDARAVPLRQLMLELGFSDEEFAELRRSQVRSDALVRTERAAMRAMKGQHDGTDTLGRPGVPNQALAIRLMHDSAYHAEKARVMGPIDDFFALLDARTAANTERYERRGTVALALSSGLVVVLLGLTLLSFVRLRRRVYVPVAALQNQTQMIAADLDRLAAVATDIAGGDLSRSFESQTVPLRVRGRDEVGQLARLHDSMAARLQETGAAIAGMTGRLRTA